MLLPLAHTGLTHLGARFSSFWTNSMCGTIVMNNQNSASVCLNHKAIFVGIKLHTCRISYWLFSNYLYSIIFLYCNTFWRAFHVKNLLSSKLVGFVRYCTVNITITNLTRYYRTVYISVIKDWISFWVHLLDHERNGQTG